MRHASPVWRARDELSRSVPGMGPVCARTRVLDLPELGPLRRQRLAALGGVAPCNRDRGTLRGIRMKLSIDSFRKHDGFVVLTYTLLQYLRGGPSFSRGLGRQTFGGGTDVGEKAA